MSLLIGSCELLSPSICVIPIGVDDVTANIAYLTCADSVKERQIY